MAVSGRDPLLPVGSALPSVVPFSDRLFCPGIHSHTQQPREKNDFSVPQFQEKSQNWVSLNHIFILDSNSLPNGMASSEGSSSLLLQKEKSSLKLLKQGFAVPKSCAAGWREKRELVGPYIAFYSPPRRSHSESSPLRFKERGHRPASPGRSVQKRVAGF